MKRQTKRVLTLLLIAAMTGLLNRRRKTEARRKTLKFAVIGSTPPPG
jgi:hypothetical protein